jgi:tRNA threonylcarbamoyl adenosine modification protein YeaZ
MILYINTIGKNEVEVGLKADGQFIAKTRFEAERAQAEKLLPEAVKLLKKNKLKLKDIDSVEVENSGGSFTSLRIGVVTANALGFALGVPVRGVDGAVKKVDGIHIVEPKYDREPDIGIKY